jgi:hypothetical protein
VDRRAATAKGARVIRRCLLLLPLIAACSETQIIQPDYTVFDEFFQESPEQVDVLLIVDNSCSMLAEQEKLATEFEAFVEFFHVAQTDFHIGVTTTDMYLQAGALIGNPYFITATTPNPGEVFRTNVQVGAGGSGFERGFEAAWSALSPSLRNNLNAGFYREDAALAVIFVSDEDDASPYAVRDWTDAFWDFKGQRNRELFTASALVGVHPITLQPASCGRMPDDVFAGADDAPRYWDMVEQTGGVIRSICESDFSEVVNEIGLNVSGLRDRFDLGGIPRDDAVELTMWIPGTPGYLGDGVIVPQAGLEADGAYPWVVESDDQVAWVRFTNPDSLPPLNTRMLAQYEDPQFRGY